MSAPLPGTPVLVRTELAGSFCYVATDKTFKRGRVLSVRGTWALVRLQGERDVHEWPLSALVSA